MCTPQSLCKSLGEKVRAKLPQNHRDEILLPITPPAAVGIIYVYRVVVEGCFRMPSAVAYSMHILDINQRRDE